MRQSRMRGEVLVQFIVGGCLEGHGVIKGGTIRYQPTSASAAA
jgi:hypothetical protein